VAKEVKPGEVAVELELVELELEVAVAAEHRVCKPPRWCLTA
jgi:hypothetical protein